MHYCAIVKATAAQNAHPRVLQSRIWSLRSNSNSVRIYGDPPEKKHAPRVLPFKVTDRRSLEPSRSIGYLRLPISDPWAYLIPCPR